MEAPQSNQHFTLAMIVWAALTFSIVLYMVVATVAVEVPEQPMAQAVSNALLGVGAMMLVMSIVVRRHLENFERLLGQGLEPDAIIERCMPLPFAFMIVSWAVCEGGAVMGLLVSFSTGDPVPSYLLGGAAIATMLVVHRPRRWDPHAALRR